MPRPGALSTVMDPPIAWSELATTSSPTPRPASEETASTVLRPGHEDERIDRVGRRRAHLEAERAGPVGDAIGIEAATVVGDGQDHAVAHGAPR